MRPKSFGTFEKQAPGRQTRKIVTERKQLQNQSINQTAVFGGDLRNGRSKGEER